RPFEREAALHQHPIHLLHVERGADVLDGLLMVKVLAREDVHREVIQLREGVDSDVALGDDDQARDAGIGGVWRLVLEHVGAADFGHADRGGVVVQDLLDEDTICELASVTTGTVDNQVGSEHVANLLYHARLCAFYARAALAVSALEAADVPAKIGANKHAASGLRRVHVAIGTHRVPFSAIKLPAWDSFYPWCGMLRSAG